MTGGEGAARPVALVDFRSPAPGVAPLKWAFAAPRAWLRAWAPDEVRPLLREVQARARAGQWCVGYLAYEAALAFDAAFRVHPPAPGAGPLAAFAVFDAPLAADAEQAAWAPPPAARADWAPGLERPAFDAAIARLHEAIAGGEVYQVNLTERLRGRLEGDPLALFAALRQAQPQAYAGWLEVPDGPCVMSVSPELFFDWRDGRLLARPMKGTAPRGADAAEDAALAEGLRGSVKERAENLMIVDLLRNDLSRLARPHGVAVPALFQVEAWPTVWQMSSDVVAQVREDVGLEQVFAALFPCGSVTGAPKVRAMRLIEALEPGPRGVYCGAFGVVQPGGAATFNVPIRTPVAGRRPDGGLALECGIGSGITADAAAAGEWQEWRHKRAFLERAGAPFELLETLRLDEGVLVGVADHLHRLAEAAAHFGFAAPDAAAARLRALADRHPAGAWRVRLLAARDGAVRVEAAPLAPTPVPVPVALADRPLAEAGGEFVRFKTTRRAHYERFAPRSARVFDTLLWNERGELTEFTRGNFALCLDGRWLTPELRCGLLDGIARRRLLREGRLHEAVLRREDLDRAQGLAFFNSLRGWLPARRVDDDGADGAA